MTVQDQCIQDLGLKQLQSMDLNLQQHVGCEVVGEHWVDCKHEDDGVSLPFHQH